MRPMLRLSIAGALIFGCPSAQAWFFDVPDPTRDVGMRPQFEAPVNQIGGETQKRLALEQQLTAECMAQIRRLQDLLQAHTILEKQLEILDASAKPAEAGLLLNEPNTCDRPDNIKRTADNVESINSILQAKITFLRQRKVSAQ